MHWLTLGSIIPTVYVLEGGLIPGEVLASVAIEAFAQTITFSAPTARFYVRAYATTSGVRRPPSREILITVPPPGRAVVWAMVVGESGICIQGAIVQVVSGQGIGQIQAQRTACSACDLTAAFFLPAWLLASR